MLSASTLDPHNSSDHTQLISNNWLLSTNDVTQDSVLAVFDMSPELILVPRAFIILVSVGDRSPTLTRTIEALGTRMESRAQRNNKRIHGYVRMKQQNFFFYFIILPHRWNYCGGEISEKPSLWGIEISPNFWLKQMKIAGIIPPVHENCWGTSKRFEELQEIIEMNNKYLLALIESSKKTGSP